MNIKDIKNKINPILKRNDVKRAAVFGSAARGEAKKNSDVDILIKFKKDNKTLFDLVGLKIELEEKLNKKVDVLTYDSIHPLLRNIILKEQKIIL
ncbi:MAG: nucleotidyltransferase family protein [Patescibacteria group bacterium]